MIHRSAPFALLTLGLFLGVSAAQDSNPVAPTGVVRLEAHLGFTRSGGLTSGWAPIEVSLHNTGAERTLDLFVQLTPGRDEGTLSCRRRLTLAAGGKRREWFVLPVTPAGIELRVFLRELPAEGEDESGVLVAQVEPQQYYFSGYRQEEGADARILYVSRGDKEVRRRATWIVAYGDQALLGVRTPKRLPDRALAYEGLDVVALHDADVSGLSPVQRAALSDWVRAGGTLLLVPARRLAWFNDPGIRSFLGETVVSAHEMTSLPRLERNYLSTPVRAQRPEPFVVYACRTPGKTPRKDDAYAQRMSERLPDGQSFDLLHEVAFGRGRVFVLAVDLSAPPFDRWQGRDALAADLRRRLLQGGGSVLSNSQSREASTWGGGYWMRSPFVRTGLTRALSSNRNPSSLLVVALVGLYVLCVGPLNYRALRKRDRQMLLVLTVPAISLVFCLAVVLSGYATKGLRTLVWRVTVVSTDLDARSGLEQTGVSIRSAHSTEFDVELDPALTGTRVFSNDEAAGTVRHDIVDEGSVRYPRVPLQIWEQATFEGFALRDLGGGLHLTSNAAGMRLHNETPWPLKRVVVISGGAVRVLGAVGVGERVLVTEGKVDLRSDNWSRLITEGLFEDEDDRTFGEQVLRRYAPFVSSWRGQTLVVAMLDGRISKVRVDGSESADREATLIVARARGLK